MNLLGMCDFLDLTRQSVIYYCHPGLVCQKMSLEWNYWPSFASLASPQLALFRLRTASSAKSTLGLESSSFRSTPLNFGCPSISWVLVQSVEHSTRLRHRWELVLWIVVWGKVATKWSRTILISAIVCVSPSRSASLNSTRYICKRRSRWSISVEEAGTLTVSVSGSILFMRMRTRTVLPDQQSLMTSDANRCTKTYEALRILVGINILAKVLQISCITTWIFVLKLCLANEKSWI